MIKGKIEIHDKFSVIIDVTYDTISKKKKSKYTTLTYLFLPDSLNINGKTYTGAKFYNDVRLFLKYDTPNYSLEEISSGERFLLNNLAKNTKICIKNSSKENLSRFKNQVKMFAATFSSLLRDETDSFIKRKEISNDETIAFLEKIKLILSEFRDIVVLLKNTSLKDAHKNVMFYADEHMSNVVELELMKLFNSFKNRKIGTNSLELIVALIESEQKYKKQKNYVSPKDKNVNPEDLLYKRNRLKKYIESVFFLYQDIRKDGALFEQTVLALAAGLAMVFSTAVAFYYQQLYGNFTMPFFIALVVGYMLKDRIKGSVSQLFVSKSHSLFYDYKIKVTNAFDNKIGIIKEKFSFVPLKKLGAKVKKHRQKDMVIGISERSLNEQIIEYKKKVTIYPKKFGNDLTDENIIGLTDITRLNFHRFIQYMDDPKKDYILVKKGEVYMKAANKVYNINIIQKYYAEEGIEFSRYRVIMNRNGIKRIEKVVLD
ncbi:hypothetical protein [Maribacter arenosus]|uniref:Uncharacterized protein n=1 Tax=Maribacter arenosus TaxID=1854708 RepID=A0ABR7VEZ9_9FLAO|nr:hypothetical protein [Maribacter arenosus]MBD0852204.1 hypothetical protein [Maribacter arenosus]